MAYSLEIEGRAGAMWSGLFYLDEVSRLLDVTNGRFRGDYEVAMNVQKTSAWSRRGFYPLDSNEFERNRKFTNFGGLITSRMIALLLSYGVQIGRIAQAHDYLKDETGQSYPFVSRKFWVESPDVSREVYAELDRMIVTASRLGQLTFTELLYGQLSSPRDMEFDDSPREYARTWHLSTGILIDPQIQSGVPCVAGTRTPTHVLRGCFESGDSLEVIADGYRLEESQVRAALDWEGALADGYRQPGNLSGLDRRSECQ